MTKGNQKKKGLSAKARAEIAARNRAAHSAKLVPQKKPPAEETSPAAPVAKKTAPAESGVLALCQRGIFRALPTLKRVAIYAAAPLLFALVMLLMFRSHGLYPFGDKTVSWCDMDSQIVPLLCNWKDVLTGKANFFYSLENAGGMNFVGVFFYYLSSPFHLLVVFVPKVKMMQFVNILVLLKLTAAAATAFVYFRKSLPRLPVGIAVALSVFYGCCGYAAMYYQILLWVDAVYLFPLLLLGLERLIDEGKPLLYTVTLALTVVICFYISFMCVLLVLLFTGVSLLYAKNRRRAATLFVVSSAIAAMISAVSYLPLLAQYAVSGRTGVNLVTSLQKAGDPSFTTTLPMLLGGIVLLPFLFSRKAVRADVRYFAAFLLLLAPFFSEPINLLWHAGSYNSFPVRFGFMANFMTLVLVARALTPREAFVSDGFLSATAVEGFLHEKSGTASSEKTPRQTAEKGGVSRQAADRGREPLLALLRKNKGVIFACASCAVSLFALLLTRGFYQFSREKSEAEGETLGAFSHRLWGNDASFSALCSYYLAVLAFVTLVFFLYRTGLLKRAALVLVALALAVTEVCFTSRIYIIEPSKNTEFYQNVVELEGALSEDLFAGDEDFFRVKSIYKNYNVNYTGAAGFHSLAHYTSLTSESYLRLGKILGYESNWMEVGSHNGTTFSDALFNTKYVVHYGKSSQAVYSGEKYHIRKNEYYLPLGLVTASDLGALSSVYAGDRAEYQAALFSALFPSVENPVRIRRDPEVKNVKITDREDGKGKTYQATSSNNYLRFTVNVTDKETLYLDQFFDQSFNVGETQQIFNTLSVSVNGKTHTDNFQTSPNNGILKLGTFENQTVTVELKVKKTFSAGGLSVFGVSHAAMDLVTRTALSANMKENGNEFSGTVTANEGDWLFLSLPYDGGFSATVNGKKAEVVSTFDGFTAVRLTEGENAVRLRFTPRGFGLGGVISLLGVILFAFFVAFYKKLQYNNGVGKIAFYAVAIVAATVFTVLYLLPSLYLLPLVLILPLIAETRVSCRFDCGLRRRKHTEASGFVKTDKKI